jgi:putative oxidoreductase
MLASRLQTLVKTKGTILDRWLADRQEWAPIALRVPLGVIFFAHGAQKMFGWFGWNGTMQYFTQSLHIPAPLAAVAILVELLGGLALLAAVFTRWTAILERGILSSGW